MSAFFAMGGYAAYIWPAYAISAIALGGAVLVCWRGYRRARLRLASLEDQAP